MLLTGKTLGKEESHTTEFVRSRTVGGVEKVPIARKFPVSFRFPTLIELGIIVSDSRGSGAGVSVTVTVAVFDTTEPSGFFSNAVIVVVPALTPEATPLPVESPEVTLAMVGMLDDHVICDELVTFCWRPVLPKVPSAMNWPV